MTRETKIGLLVGLAFIVVFAVLLSHTGTVPPPGESPVTVVALNNPPSAPVLSKPFPEDIAKVESDEVKSLTPSGPSRDINPLEPSVTPDTAVVSNPTGGDSELPRPNIFDQPKSGVSVEIAEAGKPRNEVPNTPSTIVSMRTAPQAEPTKPEPSVRPVDVIVSAAPEGSKSPADPAVTTVAVNDATTPKTDTKEAREYVVQSHDSLYKIAKGSPRYINEIVKLNNLKDANNVVQGQKLMLPADMFEGTKQFNGKIAGGKPKSMSLDDLIEDLDNNKTGKSNSSKEKKTAVKEDDGRIAERKGNFEKVVPVVDSTVSDDSMLDLSALDKPEPMHSVTTGSSNKNAKDSSKSKSKDGRSAPAKESKESKEGKRGIKDSKPSQEKKQIGSSAKMLAANKSKNGQKSGRDDDMFSWVEVKQNDTMATIAKDSLGSSDRWKEIKKLNGDVDPQKMKTGTRLKVPRSKPVSVRPEKGRISA